ncbi:YiiX/YebB-like N1pC/P60 family cysteine hydrolase [Millionella massiliensis]|uniref:YiiX/YebB-like N1pC/P60 family cysteine hydrolase n=1 Tax=Millionella massiliensis TaxID=1871023 RepID=UPI0023A8E887|nr:YiiX/YebB-like N1pC/P60 family cysteine hydrolase [Millionella massiliensis]
MMKRASYIILCGLTTALVGFGYVRYRDESRRLCDPATLPLSEIRSGDLLFSTGHSFKSDLVRIASRNYRSDCSHVGIIRRCRSDIRVVHMSIDSGVILEERLDHFIQNNRSLRIDFGRWPDSIDTLRLNQVLDSLLKARIAFDYRFDLNDNSKYYCTELIARTLGKCTLIHSMPATQDPILYPSALLNHVSIIINH